MENNKTPNRRNDNGPKKSFRSEKGGSRERGGLPMKQITKDNDFDQLIADIRRVTRVTAGGKRMSFSVTMLLGNGKGKIGLGTAKGTDVPQAIDKAKKEAMHNLVTVPIVKNTVPFEVKVKYAASTILIKPAKEGKGVIAGGVVRDIMILAGIKNVTSKLLGGSHSAINNGKAALKALEEINRVYKLRNEQKGKKTVLEVETKVAE